MAKKLEQELQRIQKEVRALKKRLKTFQNMAAQLEKPKTTPKTAPKKKAPAPKKPPAKNSSSATAFATVVDLIHGKKKGASTADLMQETGFDAKKIANIIYKAKKQGTIKSKGRGLYVKA